MRIRMFLLTTKAARIGQALVAHGALAGVAGGTVAHTDFSKTLATPSGRAALRLGWMAIPNTPFVHEPRTCLF